MTNPKHTTAEYLEWIDREYEMSELRDKRRYDNGLSHDEDGYRASLLVIRDVLVRHEEYSTYGFSRCKVCIVQTGIGHPLMTGSLKFPCPTYLDIAQRLDEVM